MFFFRKRTKNKRNFPIFFFRKKEAKKRAGNLSRYYKIVWCPTTKVFGYFFVASLQSTPLHSPRLRLVGGLNSDLTENPLQEFSQISASLKLR
jgi:hypothetical protein